LRIALVHQPWSIIVPPVSHGDSIALTTDRIARGLRKDHSVVCYSVRRRNQPKASTFDGIEYRRIERAYDRYLVKVGSALDEFGLLPPKRCFFGSSWYFRHYARGIADDLKAHAADVVHIHNFSQFAPWIKERNPRARVVLHMHADWLIELDRHWVQRRLDAVDAIICCSGYFADGIRKAWPEFASRVHVVYNGVTPEEVTGIDEAPTIRNKPRRRILFVGRVAPEKGLHILIDAFNGLVDEFPDAQLAIVGPIYKIPRAAFAFHTSNEAMVKELMKFGGASFDEYLRRRLTPAAAERVTFTGEIPRAELLRQYRDSDLFVLPAVYPEGFGVPIMEAACWGLPAVATRRGGIPEVIVDGETGRLVEAGDASGLRAAIADMLTNDAQRHKMGQTARERVKLFTWERAVTQLRHLYEEI
jgi:glycosyltransferase involved in cell wall biosynthesis